MKPPKITPGKWEATRMADMSGGFHKYFEIGAYPQAPVCEVSNDGPDEWEANARLIAAGPQLAEALNALYEETAEYVRINNLGDPHHNQCMKQARAALLQAGWQEE